MTNEKIFCIGFNKTATQSLHKFFVYNGIKSLHFSAFRNSDGKFKIPSIYRDRKYNKHLSPKMYIVFFI